MCFTLLMTTIKFQFQCILYNHSIYKTHAIMCFTLCMECILYNHSIYKTHTIMCFTLLMTTIKLQFQYILFNIYSGYILYKLKELKFVGYTKGNSVKDVPSEVTKICNEYLKFEYGYNYKLSKKFIILQKAFDNLGISKEDLLTSNPKGIYFGFTCNESKKFLCTVGAGAKGTFGDVGSMSLNSTRVCDIFQSWFNKYATNRSKSLSRNIL
jgi:hypothetical protein